MKLDSFHLMEVFVRVAEAKSFTGAASHLGISPSAASKAVSRLEEKLGVRLVVRSTRSVRLTDEGEMLLASCKNVFAELESVEARLTHKVEEPAGRLRLHSTIGFGRHVVVPLLSRFSRQWPKVTVDVDLSERDVNLHQESFDASIRFGELPDSRLVARQLGHMQFLTVASEDYLRRHGEPKHPSDLANHACLGYFQPRNLRYRDWEYIGGHTLHSPSSHLNFNNAQALMEAAMDGQGLAHVPKFLVYDALQEGRLHAVLSKYDAPGWPVSLVYPERRYQSQRVKMLVDFLVEGISTDGRWQKESA